MAIKILAGRYELIERIGEGGMAVVFRSRDRLLGRNVAIKILRPEYTKDMMFIESFRRESQLAASIVDPNIVNVYDVGKEGSIYYIVMELVEGEPLSDIIKREAPLDPRRAASITRQIAMALSTAHKHQLIHRDVKPHNILISEGDVAKISDFGIAVKATPEDADTGAKKEAVMGSIHYFSPEQARGAYVDERSDIYSLGIVLYEMLTGKVPFDGETAVEVAIKHMNEPIVPPSRHNPDIPQDLEDIVLKATQKLQTARYNSADEMITALNLVRFSKPSDYSLSLTNGEKGKKRSGDPEETPEERRARIRAEKLAEKRKRFRRMCIIAASVVLVLAVAVLLISDAIAKKREENSKTIAAPYIVGMNYDAAVEYLKQFDLSAEIELQLTSSEAVGTILSQSPGEGTTIKRGQTMKVNISRGSSELAIPSVVGKTQAGAKTLLENEGYVLGEVGGDHSDTVAKGLVMSQDPVAGTSLAKGEKVNIMVSLGPKDSQSVVTMVIVPNVMRKPLQEALDTLSAAGVVVASVTEEESSAVEEGHIISQSLAGGTEVEKGTEITLVVSKGVPEPELKTVSIDIDYSVASEDSFQVTATLQDGDQASENVFVSKKTKDSPADRISITGRSENARLVVFFAYPSGTIDTVLDHTINFQTGEIK